MREDRPIEDEAHGAGRWRKAVREHPANAAARYALGVALVRTGREDEAEAAFREATLLRPGWAEAHNALGATLCRLGRHDEAID
ncbi:MAG TPA: tetratricopeptide repeat protein, partial [Thermodesulfobacteriota bacterium]